MTRKSRSPDITCLGFFSCSNDELPVFLLYFRLVNPSTSVTSYSVRTCILLYVESKKWTCRKVFWDDLCPKTPNNIKKCLIFYPTIFWHIYQHFGPCRENIGSVWLVYSHSIFEHVVIEKKLPKQMDNWFMYRVQEACIFMKN